jgi:hypothetical protein
MGAPRCSEDGRTSRISAKVWLIVYIVAVVIFALIMLWIATSKGKKVHVNTHNGAHKLDIVEGFTQEPLACSYSL